MKDLVLKAQGKRPKIRRQPIIKFDLEPWQRRIVNEIKKDQLTEYVDESAT